MLVLTRRSNDKLSFPEVGITVHFVRVQSGQVKVGIDAPCDITIVRDEICSPEASQLAKRQLLRLPRSVRHGIRNELHQISIGLHLYRELTAAGLSQEANETFATIQEALSRLDENQALCRPKHATACSPSCSVLIVEDEENEREMLASLLRMRGYQVTTRADGQEALDYLAEHPKPQAILVDMKMPRCDGPELVRQLRTQRQIESVPVFAVSGTSPKENGLATGPEGVNRWFPKPLNPEYLLEALDALVSS